MSVQAQKLNCQLATNAGFFQFTPPACLGALIVNGTTVETESTSRVTAVFGTLRNGSTVLGFMQPDTIAHMELKSLVQGVGWLVRNGVNYAAKSRDLDPSSGFFNEIAPRTAVGVRADGSIIVLVIDGIEADYMGATVPETADILVSLGAHHAINMDGGGSTDAVLNGKVWSRPTCQDTRTPVCERNVTSITCISYP